MNVVNLTPHAITLAIGDRTATIAKAGSEARCAAVKAPIGAVSITGDDGLPFDVPTMRPSFGAVIGLPDPLPGTVFIVSALVRSAVPHRTDVLSPGDLLRDDAGAVVGCCSLAVN